MHHSPCFHQEHMKTKSLKLFSLHVLCHRTPCGTKSPYPPPLNFVDPPPPLKNVFKKLDPPCNFPFKYVESYGGGSRRVLKMVGPPPVTFDHFACLVTGGGVWKFSKLGGTPPPPPVTFDIFEREVTRGGSNFFEHVFKGGGGRAFLYRVVCDCKAHEDWRVSDS